MTSLPFRLSRWISLGHTAFRLGVVDILRVTYFRLKIAQGTFLRAQPIQKQSTGPWWLVHDPARASGIGAPCEQAVAENLGGKFRFFCSYDVEMGDPVDWFATGDPDDRSNFGAEHWTHFYIKPPLHWDIKRVWEPSRFTWAPAYARSWASGAGISFVDALNSRVSSWVEANPPFSFPNWSCGQEAAIRAVNLVLADLVLKAAGTTCTPNLSALLRKHCQRISVTTNYAIGQRNNHAVSEAAGLFIVGTWLSGFTDQTPYQVNEAQAWQNKGRSLLERAARQLILEDGGFALLSTTYHRAVLDLFCVCELIRQLYELTPFSRKLQTRVAAAARWQASMVFNERGDSPNLGGNDGTLLFDAWDNSEYRNFGVSVQRYERIFGSRLRPQIFNLWADEGLLPNASTPVRRENALFPAAGIAILHRGSWSVMLRLGRCGFRPVHTDALHLDLWHQGRNILGDGGSFDYADQEANAYFTGPKGHNVIEFDGAPPMRPVGRFLYMDWIDTRLLEFTPVGYQVKACNTDYRGYKHQRTVTLGIETIIVIDRISGGFRAAKLRWRLDGMDWKIVGDQVIGASLTMRISTETRPVACKLVPGWVADHYGTKRPILVVEVDLDRPVEITTTIATYP